MESVGSLLYSDAPHHHLHPPHHCRAPEESEIRVITDGHFHVNTQTGAANS